VQSKALIMWIAALAVIIRFVYISRYGDFMSGPDADTYSSVAIAILKDGAFVQVQQVPYWPIGYPWFLAVTSAPFGGNFIFSVVAQILISGVGIFCFGLILKNIFNSRIAILSSTILAINPALVVSSTQLMYETVQIFLAIIGCYLCLKLSDKSNLIKRVWLCLAAILILTISAIMQLKILGLFLGLVLGLMVCKQLVREKERFRILSIFSILIGVILIAPAVILGRNLIAGDGLGVSKNYQVHVIFGLGDGRLSAENCTNPSKLGYDDIRYIVCLQKEKVIHPVSGLKATTRQTFDLFSPYLGHLAWKIDGNGTWYHGIDPRKLIGGYGGINWHRFVSMDIILSSLWMSFLIFTVLLGSANVLKFRSSFPKAIPLVTGVITLALVSILGDGDSRHRLSLIPLYTPLVVFALSNIFSNIKVRGKR
jgi:4-amino-4-deoxy-L-arabinose transferase-like glycosyltransferase